MFSLRHRDPQWLLVTGSYSFHCEPIIAAMLISLFNYSAGSHGRAVIKRKISQSEQCQSLAARYSHMGTERYWAHLRGPASGSKRHLLRTSETLDSTNTNLSSWPTSKSNHGNINYLAKSGFASCLRKSYAPSSAQTCQCKAKMSGFYRGDAQNLPRCSERSDLYSDLEKKINIYCSRWISYWF